MPTGNIHPSFAPIWHSLPERGWKSPHAHVEYEVENHTHMVMLGDGVQNFYVLDGLGVEDSIEEASEELRNAIERCDESRHKGHGRQHRKVGSREIMKACAEQLTQREFDREFHEVRWLQAMYKKWGGHIPALVFVPTEKDPEKWEVMIPDSQGNPQMYPLNNKDLQNVLPPATSDVTKKLPGYGYHRKHNAWSRGKRRLETLHRSLQKNGR